MKKMVCLSLILYCFVLILAGCSNKADLAFAKVELQDAPKEVQNFVDKNKEKNGVYLYSSNNIDNYLFLNAFNVNQGEKAVFFKNIKYDINENTLSLYFNTVFADDYTKKLDNSLIYQIKTSNKYDTIKVFRNGGEIAFDVIGN